MARSNRPRSRRDNENIAIIGTEYIMWMLDRIDADPRSREDEAFREIGEQMLIDISSQYISRMTDHYTGMITEAALQARTDKTQPNPTKEHFYTRSSVGKIVIARRRAGRPLSKKRIVQLFKSRCRVHYTTKEENNALATYTRNNPSAFWRTAYADACSPLVKDPKPFHRKGNRR